MPPLFLTSPSLTIRQKLAALLRLGAQHAVDATILRKIVQTNMGVLLLVANVLAFNAMFLMVGNSALIQSGVVQLPLVVILALGVPLLNFYGWLTLARWLLFMGVTLDIFAAMMGGQGTAFHIHWYFLVIAVVSTVFFPAKQWLHSVAVTVMSVTLFMVFQIYGWPSDPAVKLLSAHAMLILQTTMVASCAVIIVIVMLYSERSAARNELELQLMADTDPLTLLPNRRAFRARLMRDLDASERAGLSMAVAMMDIDHFKRINDQYGHDMGDSTLQLLAKLLLEHLRADDTVARMGGEEFAVLMPRTTVAQAQVIVERMRVAVARQVFGTQEIPLTLSISVGLAGLAPGASADQVMKSADAALYEAKDAGRNRVMVHAG